MYKQSHPIAAHREIIFSLRAANGSPVTGQTFATTDLQIRKPGASAWANCNSTQQTAVVEIGGGDYVYTFTTAELDTPGSGLGFKVNKAGALQVDYTDAISPAFFATVTSGSLTTSQFTTDRTETLDNYWKDAFVVALSGVLIGQVKKVNSYTGASKMFALAAGSAFTSAPNVADVFEIIDR